jgi:hypothetical protein
MKADKTLVNYKTLVLKNISDSKDKENCMLHCAERVTAGTSVHILPTVWNYYELNK